MFARKLAATPALSRRGFLKVTGGVGIGLIIGVASGELPRASAAASGATDFNPFLRIAPDGTATVLVKHLDMGQGTANGLATLVADELDAAWDQVRVEFAPADAT